MKFMYLTDIYFDINWWKTQQNIPSRFLEILVFLGGVVFMPHPVKIKLTGTSPFVTLLHLSSLSTLSQNMRNFWSIYGERTLGFLK